MLHLPATHRAGVQRTGVQSSFVLRSRPTDGLSVELEGWTPSYQIASVGCSLTRCTPPWRSERADVIISAPLQGRLIYQIAVSTVTGRFMLKPDPTTTNYILYLLVPSFASSRGCRGRELGGMINMYTTYYYTMLQQLLLHCYLYCFIELLAFSSPMLQDSSEDASLR